MAGKKIEEEENHVHDHDHDHEEGEEWEEGDEDDDIVILSGPDGEAKEYVFLTLVEVDGAQFALLTPADEPEDEEAATEVYIFRYEQDEEGGEMFSEVEDEALFQRVQAEAEKILVTDEEDDA